MAESLRRVDQRYTKGRRELIEALARGGRPLTASELVATTPALPQSTAYRNLAMLGQAGVVHRVLGSDDFARYELSEGLTGDHHHHLVCLGCGAVEDFSAPARLERSMASLIDEVSGARRFRVETHRLDLYGTCAACSGC